MPEVCQGKGGQTFPEGINPVGERSEPRTRGYSPGNFLLPHPPEWLKTSSNYILLHLTSDIYSLHLTTLFFFWNYFLHRYLVVVECSKRQRGREENNVDTPEHFCSCAYFVLWAKGKILSRVKNNKTSITFYDPAKNRSPRLHLPKRGLTWQITEWNVSKMANGERLSRKEIMCVNCHVCIIMIQKYTTMIKDYVYENNNERDLCGCWTLACL